MLWMLMVYLQSGMSLDGLKPVQTFYQSEADCTAAEAKEADKGHYGYCAAVTWK